MDLRRIIDSPFGREHWAEPIPNNPHSTSIINNVTPMDENVYLDITAVAPSPSRDYYRLRVDKEKVNFTRWLITHKSKIFPAETIVPHAKFHEDHRLAGEINGIFGQNITKYVIGLCEGRVDWITRLPTKILTKILGYVGIKNLSSFAPVSKQFHEISNSNALWKIFYQEYYRGKIPAEMLLHANYLGWKTTFFINRLQFNVFPGKKMRLGLEDATHYGTTSVAPGSRRRPIKPGKLISYSQLEIPSMKQLGGGDTLKSKISEYQRKVSGNAPSYLDSSSSTPNLRDQDSSFPNTPIPAYLKYESIRQSLGLAPKPSTSVPAQPPPTARKPPTPPTKTLGRQK